MNRHRLVAAAVAFGTAVALVSAAAQPAAATKEYGRKERKDCSHCHINDKGAGPRNEVGRMYEANGYKFGVKSWSTGENRRKYLRANSAYLATWYYEALRLLDELEAAETLPGGLALVGGRRDRMQMFPKAWIRSAKKLLGKGDRGVPNAVNRFLVRLESQFPSRTEGEEAVKLLDELSANEKHAKLVADARAREKLRVLMLQGRTELGLGNWDKGRALLEAVREDPLAEPFVKDVNELLAEIPADE